MNSPHTPLPSRRLLLCDVCGRVLNCYPHQLSEFTRKGWPKCCGETMALFTESPHPQSPDGLPPDSDS